MKVPLIISNLGMSLQRIQEKLRFFSENAVKLEKYSTYLLIDTCADSYLHLLNMPKKDAFEFFAEFCMTPSQSDFGLNALEAKVNGYSLRVVVQIQNNK